MFTVTHFRSEFVRQSQATILRKVTMTQFLFVVAAVVVGIVVLGAPYWLAPLFMALGYAAGISYQGEIIVRRLVAYAQVWLRSSLARPRIVNVQQEWERVRLQAESRQVGTGFQSTVVLE